METNIGVSLSKTCSTGLESTSGKAVHILMGVFLRVRGREMGFGYRTCSRIVSIYTKVATRRTGRTDTVFTDGQTGQFMRDTSRTIFDMTRV
jgi:hypothetical protein